MKGSVSIPRIIFFYVVIFLKLNCLKVALNYLEDTIHDSSDVIDEIYLRISHSEQSSALFFLIGRRYIIDQNLQNLVLKPYYSLYLLDQIALWKYIIKRIFYVLPILKQICFNIHKYKRSVKS